MRIKSVFVLIVAALVIPVQAAEPEGDSDSPLVLRLKDDPTVTSYRIRVDDLATISGGSEALRARIGHLDLIDLPESASSVVVKREQVCIRLRLAGVKRDDFRVEGPQRVTVRRKENRLEEQEIITAAQNALLQRLPWKKEELDIQLAQPLGKLPLLAVSHEEVRLEPEMHVVGIPLGRSRVDVLIYERGQQRQSVPVQFTTKLVQTIAVASRRIAAGELLNEQNLRFETRSLERLDNYLTTGASIVGKRALVALAPGTLIVATDVEVATPEDVVLVKNRDVVRLLARVGPLQVTTTGQALQDGRAGQLIGVLNLDSKKTVFGRVMGRSTVKVDY